MMKTIPKYNELMLPVLKALRELGGSGTNDEITEAVISLEKYPEEITSQKHNEGPTTELEYRIAWARSYLKDSELLENPSRGLWSLTERGRNLKDSEIDAAHQEAKRRGQARSKARKNVSKINEPEAELDPSYEDTWKEDLLDYMMTEVSPPSFERLCQLLLRRAGFTEVKVTGRSGDGGIDGYGVLRSGLLSENVLFQCKRYQSSVGPSVVRDFRGAMQGRTTRGIILTTGTFTSESKKEAVRDGAPPVELIDGERLCDLLKEYRIGLKVEQIERVTFDRQLFAKEIPA